MERKRLEHPVIAYHIQVCCFHRYTLSVLRVSILSADDSVSPCVLLNKPFLKHHPAAKTEFHAYPPKLEGLAASPHSTPKDAYKTHPSERDYNTISIYVIDTSAEALRNHFPTTIQFDIIVCMGQQHRHTPNLANDG